MVKVELERVNGAFGFEAKDANGHTIKIDTSPETGGENFGVRPMQLIADGPGGLQRHRYTFHTEKTTAECNRISECVSKASANRVKIHRCGKKSNWFLNSKARWTRKKPKKPVRYRWKNIVPSLKHLNAPAPL